MLPEERHVAEGAEARMRQLIRAMETTRPPHGARRLAWDVTGPIRAAVPALQDTLGNPAQVNLVSILRDEGTPGDVAEAVLGEGLRLPRWPEPGPVRGVLREGARLLGHVEQATGQSMGVVPLMVAWTQEDRRRRGMRGAAHRDAVTSAVGDPANARRFGMALADAALGVPGAAVPGLPAGFAFDYLPTGRHLDDSELAFATVMADRAAVTGYPDDELLFEAFRLLGRFERLNGLGVDAMFERERPDGRYGFEEFSRDCVRAATERDHGLERTSAPSEIPVPFELVRYTRVAYGPDPY